MPSSIVLGENGRAGKWITLEVPDLAEAAPAILEETVRPNEIATVIIRGIGAVGQVENQQRFPGLAHICSSVRICVQELVVRRIVRHQDGRPKVNRLSPEEAEV